MNIMKEGRCDKNVYVYLVLFATLMMVIGGSVAAFMAAADIITQHPTINFDDYREWKSTKPIPKRN